jgi:NitT/TauT family transport system substrate-binding protein
MGQGLLSRRRFLEVAGGAAAVVTFEPLSGLSGRARAAVKLTHAEAVETLYYLPLYVAKAEGFFEKEGLDVTIFNAQQRTIAVRAVVAGDAFTYCGDPAEPALARERGADIKNIGVIVYRAGGGILSKAGFPRDPKQWKGAAIIIPRPPHTSVSLIQLTLMKAGYTQADQDGLVWKPADGKGDKDLVKLHPVIAATELAALVAGQGQLSVALEPDLSNGVVQGFEIVTTFAEEFGPYFYTSIAAAGSSIKGKAELLQRYTDAMTRAMMWGHKYPDKAAQVAVKRYAEANPKIVAEAAKRIIAQEAYPKNMLVSKASYDQNFNNVLVRTKHPAAGYKWEELMDLSFAEKAASKISAKDL